MYRLYTELYVAAVFGLIGSLVKISSADTAKFTLSILFVLGKWGSILNYLKKPANSFELAGFPTFLPFTSLCYLLL